MNVCGCYRYDFMYVQITGDGDEILMNKQCGYDVPGPLSYGGTALYIIFHTDYSVIRSGWKIVYTITSYGKY